MSATSEINAITLQVLAEGAIAADQASGSYGANIAGDPDYYGWQGSQQTIPLGMNGAPEQFAAALRAALPAVNTLRLPFNAYSFDASGALAPQYERFLSAAAGEGFHIIFTYSDGVLRGLGNGDGLTSDQVYDRLSGLAMDRMTGAWHDMMAWAAAHPEVASNVYGYELVNEPAAYNTGASLAADPGAARGRFISLYATQMAQIAHVIEGHSSAHVLVGGAGYSAQFDTLANTAMGGTNALNYLRAQVGDALVWSAHLYPGWLGSNGITDAGAADQTYANAFAPLGDDNIIVTETNLLGSAADDYTTPHQEVFTFARAQEWLGAHGIGMGWFAGAQTGASSLVNVDGDGTLRFLHQDSFALAMNAFSLDDAPPAHAGAEDIAADLIAGRLRNEVTDPDYDAAHRFDPVHHLGIAFGYGGDDTLHGAGQANNFLYGGTGNDLLQGAGHEDFLFGQAGDDFLLGHDGNDRLFGGEGADTLAGGQGNDLMTGGHGADLFVAEAGSDVIVDFSAAEGDRISFGARYDSFGQIAGHEQLIDAGRGAALDLLIRHDDGTTTTILDIGRTLEARDVSFADVGGPAPVPQSLLITPVRVVQAGDEGGTITGGAGMETLNGGAGNDVIIGTTGTYRLFGGAGADTLISGSGASTLVGGAGNDRLEADVRTSGQTLAGRSGADTFVFNLHEGATDTASEVTDFTPGTDRLVVDGQAIDLGALPPGLGLESTDAGALLHLDAHHTVLFAGLFA